MNTDKERNRRLVQDYLGVEFWKPNFDDMFAEDVVMDIPSAPPGMPQRMDAFDVRQYREWLARTVSAYTSEPRELYGTPDPGVFWAIRDVSAEVKWCKRPGRFESRVFCRVELARGKIRYVAINWNPLAFLYAIHADVPLFA
jgi:hypothetical protein